MDTTINDAAFRLVSHSLVVQASRIPPLKTDKDRLVELRAEFPDTHPSQLADAIVLAHLLEETAIELADADCGPGDGTRGVPLTTQVLADQFPGFSWDMLCWALEDGFMMTRK